MARGHEWHAQGLAGCQAGSALWGGLLGGSSWSTSYVPDRHVRDVYTWTWTGAGSRSIDYDYDSAGRLSRVSAFGHSATYGYDPATGRKETLTYSGAGLTGTWTHDTRGRLDAIDWKVGANVLSRHDYGFDALHRRTSAERENGETWRYDYNDRGEVTQAVKKADNTAGAAAKRGLQSGYGYDLIGNRIMDQQHTPTSGNGLSEAVWTANALNQITERENHDSRWVFGHVKEAATLTVSGNSGEVIREGEEFAIPVSRTGAATDADWHSLDVTATLAGAGRVVNGTPLDVTTQRQGKVWFPTSPEDLQYDDDGNLTQDGRWNFTWNAENRLIRAETRADVATATGMPQERLDMAYDAMGRRIRKAVYQLETSNLEPETWVLKSDLRFLYEGTSWNLVAEIEMSPSLPVSSSPSLVRSYAWGTDISGTMDGAGGVGGLLFVQQLSTTVNNSPPSSTISAPCYDGNGNISTYVKVVDGAVSSRHDYDAFGRPIWNELEGTGVKQAATSSFGFSTKYLDAETGLVFYGFRYYSPELGRWPSRDPIEEQGGANLYGFVNNDPVNYFDADGRFPGSPGHGDKISPADSAALIKSEQNKADATFDSSLPNARNPRHASLGRNLYRLNSIRKAIGTDAGNKFVFTCKYGWIDHGHFYNNAWLTYMTGGRALPAIGSWLNEARQWLFGSDSSWTLEDLESNALGRQLGQDALDHDRPVVNSKQNQSLGMRTTFAQTLNQRRPNIPISGGQFYHIAAAWKRLLREGGAVHYPDDRDIRGLVDSILDEDIRHYLSNPINIMSLDQARAFRQTSKAWQCLCNGDKPSMNALIYR